MLNGKQKLDLQNVFEKFKQIKIAYLFGSYAENKENVYSDIDIDIGLISGIILFQIKIWDK